MGKRAGHKTFVLCPCRAINGETFVADTTGDPDVVSDYKTMYENTLKIALNSTCMKVLNKNVLPYVYLALF